MLHIPTLLWRITESGYYSEENPFEGDNAVASGNYWRYDTDGVSPSFGQRKRRKSFYFNPLEAQLTGLLAVR